MTANLDKEWNDAKERLTQAQNDLDNTVQELVDWAVGTVKDRGLASRIAGLEQELREHENNKVLRHLSRIYFRLLTIC